MVMNTNDITVTKVNRASEAHLNGCETCGILERPQFWGLDKQRGMHIYGTGHKVGYVVLSAK